MVVVSPEVPGSIDGTFSFNHMTRMLLLRGWSEIMAENRMHESG